jgi:hypothetical protein
MRSSAKGKTMAKNYSVNVENDEVVSIEVDGVFYSDPDEILDPDDRARVLQLITNLTGEKVDDNFEDPELIRHLKISMRNLKNWSGSRRNSRSSLSGSSY